jgi:hypothetical protein
MDPIVVSPTGTPVIPTKVVPWLSLIFVAAMAVTQTVPSHTIAYKIATAVTGLGGLFGLLSPGLRK